MKPSDGSPVAGWLRVHLVTSLPTEEYSALEEMFGDPEDVLPPTSAGDWDWGTPDLRLYDTYVAGIAETYLNRGGALLPAQFERDRRLDACLEYCEGESGADPDIMRWVSSRRSYLDHLAEALELIKRNADDG